jgi:ATP-binding cassette subfamily B multidrug efflux pump
METEWLIQQALSALMLGRTTVVIAQRLRTLKRADLILVLEEGRIVQHGIHDTLVSQPGLYQRIYDLQLRDQEDVLATNGRMHNRYIAMPQDHTLSSQPGHRT